MTTSTKDHKARYGYQPSWDKQREKQSEAAANYYERMHGPIEEYDPDEEDSDGD